MSSVEPQFSAASIEKLQTLDYQVNTLQQRVSEMEAILSQVITTQDSRISELESRVDPYSNSAEAICKYLDQKEIYE